MTGQINNTGINQTYDMTKIISGYIDANGQISGKEQELEELFDEVKYFNSGTDGAADIQAQIDRLEKGIEALKKEAEEIQAEIDEHNLTIEDKAKKLADIVSDINGATEAHKKAVKQAAQKATSEAINNYKANGGNKPFQVYFTETFNKKLNYANVANMNGLKQKFADCAEIQSSIAGVADEIGSLLDRVTGLENRLTNTNATANLLTKTKNNLATEIENAYKNVDTDSKKAVYSGKKAKVADSILNTDFDSTKFKNMKTTDEIKASWVSKIPTVDTKASGFDPYNQTNNPQLKNLGEAINNGMLDQLQQAGMNKDEIMEFISTNWITGRGNNGIHKQADGSWYFPAGHGTSGHQETNSKYKDDADGSSAIYTKLKEFCEKDSEVKTTATAANKEDVSRLYAAMNPSSGDDILTQMYKAGFTFKEAMCVIMDKFPDAGITYEYANGEQSKGRNYSMVADNNDTGNLYKGIAEKIKNYWNVDKTQATEKGKSVKTEETQGDPITFQIDDTTYTFINDRDGDGTFDYTSKDNNDLMGSKDGMSELSAYDTDGNGAIEGDELKNIILMANRQEESVANSGDVDKYKQGDSYENAVDFNVSYTTAADLGITRIDLSTIKDADEGTKSANGATTLKTFEIEMGDKKIDAKETNDNESYLETFYKQVADNANGAKNNEKIYSSISHDDFTKAMSLDNAYNDDVKTTAESVKSMKEYLEKALADAQAYGDSDLFKLNMDFETFKNMYSFQDGHFGTYIQHALQRGAKVVEGDPNDKENYPGHLNDTQNSTNTEAITAVSEEMDALAKETEVKAEILDKKDKNQ